MLSYAVVTPVRNETENLERLEACLRQQTARPREWVIVDTGSEDDTLDLARRLARHQSWIHYVPTQEPAVGEGPIVRAFDAGVRALRGDYDVIVKLDADISMEDRYFARLLAEFASDPRLGIASGTCFEQIQGDWRERHVTGNHVWGACRAYRTKCLSEVSPLEQRMGWDGIDTFKAAARGWRTATFVDLPFRHHRMEGVRDGSRWQHWRLRGEVMHYMGYRPTFVFVRTVHRAVGEPAAIGLAYGWAVSMVRREQQVPDREARDALRRQQRLRVLPLRILEVLGKRGTSTSSLADASAAGLETKPSGADR